MARTLMSLVISELHPDVARDAWSFAEVFLVRTAETGTAYE